MIRIFNNIIPFKGFLALTVWPFVFIRKDHREKYNVIVNRHEHIHAEQQKEVLAVAIVLAIVTTALTGSWLGVLWLPLYFYIYIIEWLMRLAFGKGDAYRNISFEREAYDNELDPDYLSQRIPFAWLFI